jgi:RNA polymerase sigma factor (sigma-70 family)
MPTPSHQQPKLSATELFERYHHVLRRRVRAVVDTSEANVEDACMYAWTKVLGRELDDIDVAHSWLTTVAIREAVKLERRSRRTDPLTVGEHGDVIEIADPRDELRLSRLLADAGEVITAAGLSSRQTQILGLQVLGLTYAEIAAEAGDSQRTIERQIMRARHKLAQALSRHGGERPPRPGSKRR